VKSGVLFAFIMCLPGLALAGDWHVTGTNDCGDCHLQHGSNQRDPTVEGAYSSLLRKSSVNELCMSCHDGTDPSAPDVVSPAPMYSSTSSGESGAGVLLSVGFENPNGHTLGVELPVPLTNAPVSRELTCVSCHAPHGNGNYRNLLVDPAGTGASIIIQYGVDVFVGVSPDNPPTSEGSINAYSRDNIGYVSSMTAWCSSCHDQLALNSTASAPAHFNAHPSDIALDAYFYDGHTDVNHWLGGTGEGFAAVLQSQATPRLPFLAPAATDFETSRTATAASRVTCVTCHKAHGSSYRKGMVWPYLDENESNLAGCQQCHNK
jgi:predicted CXXCH cytochrome family protein